jgi:hypothetical protein
MSGRGVGTQINSVITEFRQIDNFIIKPHFDFRLLFVPDSGKKMHCILVLFTGQRLGVFSPIHLQLLNNPVFL